MSTTRVIKWKHIPSRPPTSGVILWYLFLDRISAPGWAWGAMGLLFVLLTVVWVHSFWGEEPSEPEWKS